MENIYYPEVVQCVAGEAQTVYAYFSDGTIHLFDVEPLIKKGGVFEKLNDATFFKQSLTVMNGTVAWDVSSCFDARTCIDIDPFTVYESPCVTDPLETLTA